LNAYDAMKIKESGQAGCKVSKYNYYGTVRYYYRDYRD
jgi:hypothetical protein